MPWSKPMVFKRTNVRSSSPEKVKPEARTQIGTPYYLSPEVPMSMGSKMAMGTLSSTIHYPLVN